MHRINKVLHTCIHNLNFRNKILLVFLFVSLIPLCILGTFSFVATRTLLTEQKKVNLNSTLNQTLQMLDKEFASYDKAIHSLSFNKQISHIAETHFTSPYDMYEQLKFLDELFIMTQNLTTGIDRITYYTDVNLTNHGNTVLSINDVKHEAWYSHAISSVDTSWQYTPTSILCIRPVSNYKLLNEKSNYIVLYINLNALEQSLQAALDEDVSAIITDSDYHIISEINTSSSSPEIKKEIISAKTVFNKKQNIISMSGNIPHTNWNLTLYSSYQDAFDASFLIPAIALLTILFCLILVILVSHTFSKKIVHRIHLLRENMHEIEHGTLTVTVTSTSNDEIGELIQGFANMVERIKQLVEENYAVTVLQKESEFKALQAQINPHFLYNSLSLINWRAIRLHAKEISEMAQLLSSFYRTALNRGSNMTLVSEELLNVKSYLQIQLIMHSHDFSVEYQIDETVCSCSMPNLMLQPLVENAILHGLEHKEDVNTGKIILSCLKKNDVILFSITDNGIGIEKELLPTILEKQSNGYGLKNVNQRAKLLYGEEYGLQIMSTKDVGTTVSLLIPAAQFDEV